MIDQATTKDLRSFGFVFTVAFSVFGLWGAWNDGFDFSELKIGLLSGAVLFLVLALVAPGTLRVPHKLWMAFGEKMGHVVTTVLLSVFFFTVITATGLLRRVLGKDSMGLKRKAEGESYWRPKEPEERGTERYEYPF